MAEKRFHIPKDQIRGIVSGHGSCVASDRIMVDGARVGFMYREAPEGAHESGWHFMAGDESPEYCDDPAKWGIYDVNTIANYDSSIVRFLEQPPGSEYERDANGALVRADSSSVPERNVFAVPDAEGESDLDQDWVATFPARFRRRIEEPSMIAWRPGLTFWLQGWGTRDESSADVRARMERDLPPGAYDVVREQDSESWRTLFRVESPAVDKRRPALSALIWSRGHLLQVSAYFDDEADLSTATGVIRSIRARGPR